MKRSIERILTTHTGSLPRTAKVVELLLAEDKNFGARRAELQAAVRDAVAHVVHKQVECGIDVINDGEQGRTDYTVHVLKRLTGYEGESAPPMGTGEPEFPELAEILKHFASPFQHRPACSGPVAWKDWAAAEADIALAKAALAGVKAEDIFMTSPSPGQRALPQESLLQERRGLHLRARRRDAARVHGDRRGRLHPAARLPGPGDAAPHGLPQFAARRLPQDHCRQRRRA
jgi:5-methyltetrahydropteroyltriglutamate--homocysteine methyltransferase